MDARVWPEDLDGMADECWQRDYCIHCGADYQYCTCWEPDVELEKELEMMPDNRVRPRRLRKSFQRTRKGLT